MLCHALRAARAQEDGQGVCRWVWVGVVGVVGVGGRGMGDWVGKEFADDVGGVV